MAAAALLSITLVPALMVVFVRGKIVPEHKNPINRFLIWIYGPVIKGVLRAKALVILLALAVLAVSIWPARQLGTEFMPNLNEGTLLYMPTTLPGISVTKAGELMQTQDKIIRSFPEVASVYGKAGRASTATDPAPSEMFETVVNLKPKEQWRPVFKEEKEALIAAMDRELEKLPGVLWNFSQPIADNMEEAVSGVKGELAIKVYGDDLKTLEQKGDEIVNVMRGIKGIQDLGLFRVIGQPNLNLEVDRQKASRYGINVADVQDAIQTAVGGNALTQVLQGEQRYDLVLRYQPRYRNTEEAIEQIRLLAPTGERVSLAQLTNAKVLDGASEIYREGNSRYVAIKYSVRGRDLGSTVEEAIAKVGKQVQLPTGYRIDWAGEYASQKRSQRRLAIVLPITILVIFIILYTMFHSFKWATLMLANIAMAPLGGLLALYLTGTNFSVSSGVGFLALFGVCVQTGVIMLEYINQLRARGHDVADAAVEGAVLRLRPIMMTTLVATLGLLPAALSRGIGSDSQRPFAIVIVGGLMVAMMLNLILLPTLYVWVARSGDVLPAPEADFDEQE